MAAIEMRPCGRRAGMHGYFRPAETLHHHVTSFTTTLHFEASLHDRCEIIPVVRAPAWKWRNGWPVCAVPSVPIIPRAESPARKMRA